MLEAQKHKYNQKHNSVLTGNLNIWQLCYFPKHKSQLYYPIRDTLGLIFSLPRVAEHAPDTAKEYRY